MCPLIYTHMHTHKHINTLTQTHTHTHELPYKLPIMIQLRCIKIIRYVLFNIIPTPKTIIFVNIMYK